MPTPPVAAARYAALIGLGLTLLRPGTAGAAGNESLPPALQGWESWALHGHETHRCPWLAPGTAADDGRICAWPSVLELQIEGQGGRFSQRWQTEADTWLPLPGGPEQWPQQVTLDGQPAAVVAHDRRPALRVASGAHTVAGSFAWERRPEWLPIPAEVGLVALSVDGRRIALPQRHGAGIVLGAQPVARQDNRIEVRVFRLLADELPAVLATRVHLAVAGEAREIHLPQVLPDGFVPTALEGELPARLEADDTLSVQVRPGEYDINVIARGPAPLGQVQLGAHDKPWPAEEVWSFQAQDALRVVAIEGVQSTDPAQANVPEEWRSFPAYRMQPGSVLKLQERSRGLSAQDANTLRLQRRAWLDFSGEGFTVVDRIEGEMRQGWRMDMTAPFALQGVQTSGEEALLVTRGITPGTTGVELRQAHLDLTTVARAERTLGAMPATGWQQRFTSAAGQLVVGPGYRLIAALGPDSAPQSWIERWRLLDIFAVLMVATAAGRLLGLRVGLLAVAAVVLTYQDLGAPAWLWLNFLVALALVRVVPPGRLSRLVAAYRVLALGLLALALVPFLISQARLTVYPQLESSVWGGSTPGAPPIQADVQAETAAKVAPPALALPSPAGVAGRARVDQAPAAAVRNAPAGSYELREDVIVTAERRASATGYEPGVLVQAGPGMPQWRYHVYAYGWTGPVDSSATVRFLISPPWLTRLWRVAGIALSVLLLLQLARGDIARLPAWLRPWRPGAGTALLLLAALSLSVPTPSRADSTPAPSLLEDLRTRLLEPPKCLPDCADALEARVSADASRLQVTMTVSALDRVGLALPGAEPDWVPDSVQVDGESSVWIYRNAQGARYLSLAPGRHTVRIEGPLEGLQGLALSFPLAPRYIDVSAPGWDISGVNAHRLVSGAVELVRRRLAQESGSPHQEEFPPYVRVRRVFRLGHDWSIATTVQRVAPQSSAFTVAVSLLPQESVTTAGLESRDHRVTVGLAAHAQQMQFTSIIPVSESLELLAPAHAPYTERWVFQVGSTWHLEASGLPPIAPEEESGGTYEYVPRPGEHLAVRIRRPEPIAGGTLAFDRVGLILNAGKRSSDAALSLTYRSTQGGRQLLHLPVDAEVTLVRSDGDTLGIRPERGELSLPALPGRHSWTLEWRNAAAVGVLTRTPALGLSAPASNLSIDLRLPEDRWVLYAFGPGIAPAILYWGELLVFIVIAVVIGRSGLTPLPTRDWLLLGLGLSTFSWSVLALFALFVALYQWRSRSGAPADPRHFNLMQVGLAALAVIAVLAVVSAVPGGLLAHPDMRIRGGGDGTGALAWFTDQTRDMLPRPGVISVSLWWYKIAMLAWALWLSFALTRWLKWAWEVFVRDGLWRSPPLAPRSPPAAARSS